MKKEIFKDVIGYEGLYQVSNLGNVKSFNYKKNNTEKILKPGYAHGYLMVILSKNNKQKPFRVHRLVMLTFKTEEYFEGSQVNHIDGNKLNNNLDNLEWCTQLENNQHALNIGLKSSCKGENHGRSKLTEVQVKKIRFYYENKIFNQPKLAKIFNVSKINISDIIRNKLWTHIL